MQIPIVKQCLQKLEEISGQEWHWEEKTNQVDGVLEFSSADDSQQYQLPAIILSTVVKTHLAKLRQIQQRYEQLLVISGKISPGIREQLKAWGIGYLDSAGNVYLQMKNYFVFIDGQKNYPPAARIKRQLFTKTGIQIVFHLLASEKVNQYTYRELAETLDVSLGSITNTMQQLNKQGFLVKKGHSEWSLYEKEKLLKTWIMAYAEKLKPDLLLGRFRFAKRDQNWVELELPEDACWGGEPAAFLLTRYLQPAEWTLYTSQDTRTLMKHLHLLPDDNGPVRVYYKFWSGALIPETQTAPTLLVYSDLMSSGVERNFETAQKIYDEILADQF